MPTGTPKVQFSKQCCNCGTLFETFANNSKFCSKCKILKKLVVCDNCGKIFIRKPSRIRTTCKIG